MLKWFTPKEQKNNIQKTEPPGEDTEGFPESGETP